MKRKTNDNPQTTKEGKVIQHDAKAMNTKPETLT